MDELRIKINDLQGLSSNDVYFLYKALRLQKDILNSQEFFLKWIDLRPKHNRGMTQRQIYNLIMKGASRFEDGFDYELDYYLAVRKQKKGTLASTSMSTGKITINRLKFNYWMTNREGHVYLCSTLFHEALHSQIGFTHPWWPPSYKRKSVPYLGGKLVRELGLQVARGRKLTPLAT